MGGGGVENVCPLFSSSCALSTRCLPRPWHRHIAGLGGSFSKRNRSGLPGNARRGSADRSVERTGDAVARHFQSSWGGGRARARGVGERDFPPVAISDQLPLVLMNAENGSTPRPVRIEHP